MRVFSRIALVLISVAVISAPAALGQPNVANCPVSLVAQNAPAPKAAAPAAGADVVAFNQALSAKGVNSELSARALYAYRRSQGLGGRLVEAAVSEARRLGIAQLYLFTPHHEAYYAARETHHKKTEAVVTVFVDRLIGLWAMLLFASLMILPNGSTCPCVPRSGHTNAPLSSCWSRL